MEKPFKLLLFLGLTFMPTTHICRPSRAYWFFGTVAQAR